MYATESQFQCSAVYYFFICAFIYMCMRATPDWSHFTTGFCRWLIKSEVVITLIWFDRLWFGFFETYDDVLCVGVSAGNCLFVVCLILCEYGWWFRDQSQPNMPILFSLSHPLDEIAPVICRTGGMLAVHHIPLYHFQLVCRNMHLYLACFIWRCGDDDGSTVEKNF